MESNSGAPTLDFRPGGNLAIVAIRCSIDAKPFGFQTAVLYDLV